MAAEHFFTKITNDVLDATERISNEIDKAFGVGGDGGVGGGRNPTAESGGGGGGGAPTLTPPLTGDDDELLEIEEELRGSPLAGMAESVVNDIMSTQSGPSSFMEHIDAFRHAITWTEPFILSLAAFHVVMLVSCFYVSRKNGPLVPRVIFMVFVAVVVRCAEYINKLASRHWKDFASQNYFDERGIFVSIMLSAPLLLCSMIMAIMFLREATQLLVEVKTTELKRKKNSKKKNDDKQQKSDTNSKSEGEETNKKRRAKKEQ